MSAAERFDAAEGRGQWVAPPLAPVEIVEESEPESFAEMLRRFRERLQLARNRLAHEVGVDPSYLTRIEHEDRDPPRRHIVDAIARALFLTEHEYRCFVTAAGYSPVLEWHATLEAVHRRRYDAANLEAFDRTVQALADNWQVEA